MRLIFYSVALLCGLCFAVFTPQAANVYLWTDESGRMHITEGPPPEGGQVRDMFDYEPSSRSEPIEPSTPSETSESKNSDKEVQCRNVFEARRELREKQKLASAVRRRAEETRDKV